MKTSQSIQELAKALSQAQKEIEGAGKNAKNPFFKSSYADLQSVMDAAREPLTKNGLAYVQGMRYEADKTFLVTRLMHSSGEWIEGEIPLNPTKNDPQAVGSAITYMRRYSLAAMIGITQVDDDGESNRIPAQEMAVKEKAPSKPAAAKQSAYKIPFGKAAGKTLPDLTDQEMSSMIRWFEEMEEEPKGAALECKKALEDFIGRPIR